MYISPNHLTPSVPVGNPIHSVSMAFPLPQVNWHEVMEPLLEVGWFPATLPSSPVEQKGALDRFVV